MARGDRVRSVARGDYPHLAALGVDVMRGDLRDSQVAQQACQGVDVVFHTAATAGIWGPWEHYYGINTQTTLNLLEACKTADVPKFVFTSSPSVVFDGTDQAGLNETAPYPETWLCHYPHTKALAEQAVLAANGETLLTCALRPHLIWGPRDAHLIPRLIDRARSGKLRRVGEGTNMVDMIYVENAAEAHLQAADSLVSGSPVCGSAYFLSQGEPVNCWQWINEILALAKLPPVTKSIGFSAAWRIGSAMEGFYRLARLSSEPRMTRFLAAQLAKSHWYDITRAQTDFGYRATVGKQEAMERLARTMAN